MSRNSESFFRNAGRVAWFLKWRIYMKLLLLGLFVVLTLLEGIWYVLRTP